LTNDPNSHESLERVHLKELSKGLSTYRPLAATLAPSTARMLADRESG
jgi:hypothetical protein